MKYFSHIIKPPLLNQLAFYSLLGSGAYIILLWSPNVMGEFFSRYTKSIIYYISLADAMFGLLLAGNC